MHRQIVQDRDIQEDWETRLSWQAMAGSDAYAGLKSRLENSPVFGTHGHLADRFGTEGLWLKSARLDLIPQ